MSQSKTYQRFSLDQRIEHVLLITSFTTLAVTGLPQKFATEPWADVMIALMGGIELVRIIHRFAATVLMLECVYHAVVVAYKVFVRRLPMTMLPGVQDARDAAQAFMYNIGIAKDPPQMGRYNFEEKAEYWALVWGTLIMVLTGFILWNPIAASNFFAGQWIPAAKAAHGGEAILAVSAIILWHFYGVHLRHFNKSMWTGHLTEEEMHHEHPLELADMKAGRAAPAVDTPTLRKRQQIFYPVAGVTSAVLLGSVYLFTTFEKTAISTLPPTQVVQVFAPLTATPLPPTATPKPVGNLTWDGYVQPLFDNKCATCHGGSGGLSLATYADAMQGGENGPSIVPGKGAESRLVTQQELGKHKGRLSAEDIKRLTDWIDRGAPEN